MKARNFYKTLKVHLMVLVVAASAVTFHSCQLDEEPGNSQLAVLPYKSLAELELGVNGIYGQLRQTAWMTTFYVNGWSGDDMTTHRASNKADFRQYDQRFVTADNSRTRY